MLNAHYSALLGRARWQISIYSLKLYLKAIKSVIETLFIHQQMVYYSICPCSFQKHSVSVPVMLATSFHVATYYLSLSLYMSGS